MTDASIKKGPDNEALVVLGVVICENGKPVQTYSVVPPKSTIRPLSRDITDAELAAALEGLTRCAIAKYAHIELITDNRGVATIMNSERQTRSLKSLFIRDLIRRMAKYNGISIECKWKSRRHNIKADYLASRSKKHVNSSIPESVFGDYIAIDAIPDLIKAAGNPNCSRLLDCFETEVFLTRSASWQGVSLSRGTICITDRATPRGIAMAAGLLATAFMTPKSSVKMSFMDKKTHFGVTHGDLAVGWIWLIAAHLGLPGNLLVPNEHLDELRENRHQGYDIVKEIIYYQSSLYDVDNGFENFQNIAIA